MKLLKKIIFGFTLSSILFFSYSNVLAQDDEQTLSKATKIELNKQYTGTISPKEDRDYYRFDLPYDGNINLSFKHQELESSDKYWFISVIDKDGNEFKSITSLGSDVENNLSLGLPKGTYYVKITNYLYRGPDISYNLTVNFKQSNFYEKEFNETLSTATKIELNEQYTGNISSNDDEDYYKFDLPYSGKIDLNFKHEELKSSTAYWTISVIDKDKNEFKNILSLGSDFENNLSVSLPKGTYYVKVTNYLYDSSDVPYNLTINFKQSDFYEKEFNETLSTATKIELNKQYTGNISSFSDEDYYRFDLPHDGNINLTFSHEEWKSSDSYWAISIIDKNRKEFKRITSSGKALENNLSISLPKGTYYVKIAGDCLGVPDIPYSFVLSGNFENDKFTSQPKQVNVPSNKAWTVTLNKELDVKTITDKNIYITDPYGDFVSIVCYVENKTLYIVPLKEYDNGKTYTLWIENLKSKDGTVMKKNTKMDFQIEQ